jgi:1-acyl-sn-glycerol-3-phosphate acyltransferase
LRVRKLEPGSGAFRAAAVLVKPMLLAGSARVWVDGEKIPERGGCIVVCNHVTKIDPLIIAHVLYDHGRQPRYLAKAALFEVKGLGWALGKLGQIPVQRMTADAVGAFGAAVEAMDNGGCVVVYPEGTITRDPDLWPMRGKSGAARIALATGAPVIPVGHWGAQEILRPYAKRPALFPRKTVRVKVGEPVPLDDLRARPITRETVNAATDRIMAALTGLVADLRGEQAPAKRFDPRAAGVREIGNPNEPDPNEPDKDES